MAKKQAVRKVNDATIFSIIITIVALLFIGIYIISDASQRFNNTALTVNGTKISAKEYKAYLYQQKMSLEIYDMFLDGGSIWDDSIQLNSGTSNIEYAISNTIQNIYYVKICVQKAPELGINLDSTDDAKIAEQITAFKENLTEEAIKGLGLSEKDIEKLVQESVLSQKVYDKVVEDYAFDENDYNSEFESYYSTNEVSLTELTGLSIRTDSQEAADLALATLTNGLDFNDVIKQHSLDYSEDAETNEVQFQSTTYPEELLNTLFALEIGDITSVVETEDGFFIAKLTDKVLPDKEKLREERIEDYNDNKKSAIFEAEFSLWATNVETTTNDILLSSIDIREMNYVTQVEEDSAETSESADTEESEENESEDNASEENESEDNE